MIAAVTNGNPKTSQGKKDLHLAVISAVAKPWILMARIQDIRGSNPDHPKYKKWAVVVAQLVEWSLLTPEVRSLNPLIGKLYITYLLSTVLKICRKRPELA